MNNNTNLKSLTQDELVMINGGEITKDSSFSHDIAYILGYIARSYYEFVTAAASFQAALPPNLKK